MGWYKKIDFTEVMGWLFFVSLVTGIMLAPVRLYARCLMLAFAALVMGVLSVAGEAKHTTNHSKDRQGK